MGLLTDNIAITYWFHIDFNYSNEGNPMSKHIKQFGFALAGALLFLTTTADALVCRVVVLKKDNNGQPQYIHCLSESLCETFWGHIDPSQETVELRHVHGLFNKKLDDLTLVQGNHLVDFADKLEKNSVVLLNEDIEQGGDQEYAALMQMMKLLDKRTVGERGFLQHATQLFKNKSLPVINVENRQVETSSVLPNFRSLYLAQVDSVNREIEQSKAPDFVKAYSKEKLEAVRQHFNTITNYDNFQIHMRKLIGLMDSRIPHVIWDQQDKKHIFLSVTDHHITELLPFFDKMGYKKILEKGITDYSRVDAFLQSGELNGLDPAYLDTIAVDLKKILTEVSQLIDSTEGAPVDGHELKSNSENKSQSIVSNSNASSSLSQGTGPSIVCGKCGTSKPNMPHCTACKSVSYCSKDCQQKHWSTHKTVCKKI